MTGGIVISLLFLCCACLPNHLWRRVVGDVSERALRSTRAVLLVLAVRGAVGVLVIESTPVSE